MEASQFRVQVNRTPGQLTVSVAGEIDFANASELDAILQDELTTATSHLVLEFHEVTFLDSEGLKVLVRAYRSISDAGGEISIIGCNKNIGRLFDILGLRGVLGVDQPS